MSEQLRVILILFAGITLLWFLAGCQSKGGETAFLTTDAVLDGFAVAIAKSYLDCDAAAETAPEEQRCYEKHQVNVDHLEEATDYFRVYGHYLQCKSAPGADLESACKLPMVVDGGPLAQARAVLAAILPELREHMDSTHSQAIAWVEGR